MMIVFYDVCIQNNLNKVIFAFICSENIHYRGKMLLLERKQHKSVSSFAFIFLLNPENRTLKSMFTMPIIE